MTTKEFLKRYSWVYLYVAAFFLGAAGLLRHSVETAGTLDRVSLCPVIVIDAGHGAPDGAPRAFPASERTRSTWRLRSAWRPRWPSWAWTPP